jgi:hypothetical protein
MDEENSDQKTAELLAHADRLMQRRRPFVASQESTGNALHGLAEGTKPNQPAPARPPEPLPSLPGSTPLDDSDLPVLTEQVDAPQPGQTSSSEPAQHGSDIAAAQREAIQKELVQWLEQELPDAILNVTDRLADQLLGELTRKAETDLLARLLASLNTQPDMQPKT